MNKIFNILKRLKIFFKRRKTPTILQIEATECGAISLAIIFAYHGLYISSEKAREICGVTRDGSKAINIIKAARMMGMDAEGMVIRDLPALFHTQTPFIVFWKFQHFLVVEKIKKNKIYINDPETGRRTISIAEFDKNFTGIALIITPGTTFQPAGKKESSTLKILFDYFKDDSQELIYIFFASTLLAIPQAALALLIGFFIDNILSKKQMQWMPGLITLMFAILISTVLLLWIQQFFIARYKLFFSIKKIPVFFQQLLHLPMSFYTQRSSGDIANRMHIFDVISDRITKSISQSAISILNISIYSLIIILINPTIGLITLCITALNFIILIITKKKIVDLGRRYSYDKAKIYGIEYNGIQMIEELKFMNGENRFFSNWLNLNAELIESQQKIDFYNVLISISPLILYFLNLAFLIIFSINLSLQGSITPGGIIAIYTLLLLFPPLANTIINNFLKINELKADLLRVKDVSFANLTIQKISKEKTISSKNLLDIKNIYFGYSTLEAPILSEISISLKKGDTVAITGVSGGGKSSLLNLICGLFTLWSGDIYLKGKNIQSYSKKELFNTIAYVDQNIFLFEGTIRDNLTMWDSTISDEIIIDALKIACIYETIIFKGGLDYYIEEGGANISLGQAQRIELARALIKKPQLLLLDEATSALDSATEAKIYQNLRTINSTFLIVAHRLSAIKHCNEIILIENGNIIERGTHNELMNLNQKYKEFIVKDYLS